MSKVLDIIETRIDRAIMEILDIDMTLAKSTGNVSVGFKAIKDMQQTLKANAAKAVFSPKVSNEARTMHELVVRKGYKIREVAAKYGCSPSTVRRNMDKVTENDMLVARS